MENLDEQPDQAAEELIAGIPTKHW